MVTCPAAFLSLPSECLSVLIGVPNQRRHQCRAVRCKTAPANRSVAALETCTPAIDLKLASPRQSRATCPELPVSAASHLLAFVTPGHGFLALAAANSYWSEVARQPQLWWHICTRGASPLVRQSFFSRASTSDGEETEDAEDHGGCPTSTSTFNPATWLLLVKTSHGCAIVDWAAQLPPGQVLELMHALSSIKGSWKALTALCYASGAAEDCSKMSSKALATPFLPCARLFPRTGGMAVIIEDQERVGSRSTQWLWVRLSEAPARPMVLRMLLLLHAASTTPFEDDRRSACKASPVEQVLDIRVGFRGDGNMALRLDGVVDMQKCAALRTVVQRSCRRRCSPLAGDNSSSGAASISSSLSTSGHVSLALCMAELDVEGQPGGSGWIPWKPMQPSINFFQFASS